MRHGAPDFALYSISMEISSPDTTDAVAAYIFHRGRGESLAGAKIEFCAVPGTDHASVAHNAFTQTGRRRACNLVDGVNRSLNVE